MTDLTDLLAAMDQLDCVPHNGSPILDDKKRNYKNAQGKSCTYKLKCDDGDIIGWFKNHHTGEWDKYISKVNRTLTADEKKARRKKMDAERKMRERQLQDDRDESRKKAQWIWDNSERGDHPYLTKKGYSSVGTRIYKGALIIPARKDRVITSLQLISANGEKRFLKDSEIDGSYGSIGKDTSCIYISEGWATARAISEAVAPSVSVWAWNAGNMEAVAVTLRASYPNAKIVICSDNDQWRVDRDGVFENIGVIKATIAANKVDGLMAIPDFSYDDSEKRTDFDDYYRQHGSDGVRLILDKADKPADIEGESVEQVISFVVNEDKDSTPPTYFNDIPLHTYEGEYEPKELTEVNNNWGELLICDGKGNPVKTSLKNVMLFLRYHDKFEGLFKYNEFNHKVMLTSCPPWEDDRKFSPHVLNDIDLTETAAAMEDFGMSPDITKIDRAISVTADKNKFHPARDYFDELTWDGNSRLDTWLAYYLGAEDDNPEYLAFAGKKWLMAAVKRIYEAGADFHHMLVIEGDQGLGKSTALKTLATFGDDIEESYFTDGVSLSEIQDKDTIAKLQGSIIVELAELSGFNKKDDEEVKRWVTLSKDECRLPYDRTTSYFPRQFVLSATTNNDYGYLKDITGNRRYWPLKATSIDLKALKHDRKQLWAEAVHRYKAGETIIPDVKERALAEIAQEKRRSNDTWEDQVLSSIKNLGYDAPTKGFKTNALMDCMGLFLKDQDARNTKRVTNILTVHGFSNVVRRINGKSARVWVKKVVD